MTKGKLIELYKKLQKREITKEEITELKELSDEEIDIVLTNNHKIDFINLLQNENFRKLPLEVRNEIINTIRTLKENSSYVPFIIKAATNKNIIESGNLLEVIKLITKSKGMYQIDKIISIASNLECIYSGKAIELCKLIYRYNTNTEILEIAYFAAKDSHILRSGKVTEIVKQILSIRSPKTALSTYYQYANKFKELTLLEAIKNDTIEKIDFWTLLIEDPEKAVSLIVQTKETEEIDPNEKINKEQLGKKKIRKRKK